jgi:hypothetical protein
MLTIGKRVLKILLLVTMLLAIIPVNVNAALSEPMLDVYEGVYGDEVEVNGEGVYPPNRVNIYWDSVKPWDGSTGKIDTVKPESDGTYKLKFNIPQTPAGIHYIWVKDWYSGDTARSTALTVLTHAESTPDSGLEDDDIEVEGWGFVGSIDVAIALFDDFATAPATFVNDEDTGDAGDADEDEFDFTTDNKPLVVGSVVVTDGVETFTDDGDGSLTGDMGGDGSVNYITGEIEVEFEDPPAMGVDILVSYDHYKNEDDTIYLLTTTGKTNDLGTFSKEVTVPKSDDMIAGIWDLVVWDGYGSVFLGKFTIGAGITLSKFKGPTGSMVGIKGRGFTPGSTIDDGEVTIEGRVCATDNAPVDVESDGDFKLKIFIPQVGDEDDYVITVADVGGETATADFEVTELAKVEVTPEHGLQGEKVTVEGWYFSAKDGEDVDVTLGGLGEEAPTYY